MPPHIWSETLYSVVRPPLLLIDCPTPLESRNNLKKNWCLVSFDEERGPQLFETWTRTNLFRTNNYASRNKSSSSPLPSGQQWLLFSLSDRHELKCMHHLSVVCPFTPSAALTAQTNQDTSRHSTRATHVTSCSIDRRKYIDADLIKFVINSVL